MRNPWIIYNDHLVSHYYTDGFCCNTRCTRPTKNRRYIKILAMCKLPKTTSEIYGNAKNPMDSQLKALVKLGYLNRLTQKKYLKPYKHYPNQMRLIKSWWQTTNKGHHFLASLGLEVD